MCESLIAPKIKTAEYNDAWTLIQVVYICIKIFHIKHDFMKISLENFPHVFIFFHLK